MKCKQFRENLPDWLTNRLAPRFNAEMGAHSATCSTCADIEQEERRLRTVWQNIPSLPSPDLLPRLTDRLNAIRPAPGPRWNAYLTVAGTACAMAAAAWLYVGGVGRQAISYQREPIVSQTLSSPPLEDMLEGVRWRSSDEWDASREPPVYDVQMRSLLLVKEIK